jgi:AcrR family transcriptional regulator
MRVNAETKQATRQRILETARELFAREGFENATTREIARAAQIGNATLFNYFPTKESLAHCLISEAWENAAESLAASEAQQRAESEADFEPQSLEEELFAHIAAILRKLKPFRRYLPAVLATTLSPLTKDAEGEASLRVMHLEAVGQIIARHGCGETLSGVALQLYWTLLTGVLAHWSADASPRQQQTLALLDQSLAMFVGWLTSLGGTDNSANPSISLSTPTSRKGRSYDAQHG